MTMGRAAAYGIHAFGLVQGRGLPWFISLLAAGRACCTSYTFPEIALICGATFLHLLQRPTFMLEMRSGSKARLMISVWIAIRPAPSLCTSLFS